MGNKSTRKVAVVKDPTTEQTTKNGGSRFLDPLRKSLRFGPRYKTADIAEPSGGGGSSVSRPTGLSGDFNRELVLNELGKHSSNRRGDSKIKLDIDHELICSELRKLNLSKNALNYYGIENANEIVSNVLCSTCFSRDQQIDLVTLLVDSSNLKGGKHMKVSVDDLYLSCIEASSIKVSNVLLDKLIERSQPHQILKEQLASGLNRVYSTSKHLDSKRKNRSNILNVSLFKFKCAIQIHTNYLVSVNTSQIKTSFFENQSFVIKLVDAGCRLSNADMDDPMACPFLFLFLFLGTSHLSVREQHRFEKYVNRGLRYYLRQFQSFDLSTLPRDWLPTNECVVTHDELREKLYYLVKKSPFVNWSADTRARLRQLIANNGTNNRFQPLTLQQLSRATLKRHLDVSRDHGGYLPKHFRKYLSYQQEQIESLTFYLIQ